MFPLVYKWKHTFLTKSGASDSDVYWGAVKLTSKMKFKRTLLAITGTASENIIDELCLSSFQLCKRRVHVQAIYFSRWISTWISFLTTQKTTSLRSHPSVAKPVRSLEKVQLRQLMIHSTTVADLWYHYLTKVGEIMFLSGSNERLIAKMWVYEDSRHYLSTLNVKNMLKCVLNTSLTKTVKTSIVSFLHNPVHYAEFISNS